jgi:hypothetical protein
VIGLFTAFVATPMTVAVKASAGFSISKEVVAFVVAIKTMSKDAAMVDTAIILLIGLPILLCQFVMFAHRFLCFMND